jgi:hypothetical protein
VRGGGFSIVTFTELPQGLLTVYRTYYPDTLPFGTKQFTNKNVVSLHDGNNF